MSAATLPFSAREYQRRLALTRQAMAAAGIEVLFVTDPSNMAWLTGYDGWSFYVHQGVILPVEGDPFWWGRNQDANGARRTVYMAEDHLLPYAERYVQATDCHPMEDLADRLMMLGHGTARIGVEMENYYYSARAHQVLGSVLDGATLVDATALVNWQRGVKSAEEIAFMRRAARIAQRVVTTAIDTAEPGLAKNRLVAAILQAAVTGDGDDWGDYPAIVPLLPSGADAAAPHLTWNGDLLKSGEATFFELAGCYRRYHAPLCRTVHFGPPPDYMTRASEALTAGLEAGIDAARAGNRACDVADALHAELRKAGIERDARCGYPVGLSYPPDWGERTISLRIQRPDRAAARHDLPLHARPVDGRLGAGDHRNHPDPRFRPGRGAGRPAAQAVREMSLDATVAALADLVAFPTVSAESNLAMIAWLAERLEAAGARCEVLLDPSGIKGNLFATFGPTEVQGGIVLSGHTDVVPVEGQPWSSDPFALSERQGRLYGRGSCDMKGFIAACVAMAPRFAEAVRDRPLHFAFTHDEEVGCLGARALVEALALRDIRPGVCIVGEPTGMKVIEGHKGCYEYSTHFSGLEGHGSAPDRGVNAVEYAVRYVARLLDLKERLKARAPRGNRFDPPWTTINTGALSGGVAHNVIAGRASVDWEMRPVAGADADFVKAEMRDYVEQELLPAMRAVSPDAAITTETLGEVDGLEPAEASEARDMVLALTGETDPGLVAFGTEAGLFQRYGMATVICGPGAIAQAHRPDEFVALDQLAACLDMLGRLAERLGEQRGPSAAQ